MSINNPNNNMLRAEAKKEKLNVKSGPHQAVNVRASFRVGQYANLCRGGNVSLSRAEQISG